MTAGPLCDVTYGVRLLHKCKIGLSCDSLPSCFSRLKFGTHMHTDVNSQEVLSNAEYIWESVFRKTDSHLKLCMSHVSLSASL